MINFNKQDQKWYDEECCLAAVKQDTYAIQFVQNQTDEICLAAAKQDSNAIHFVHNQTEKIWQLLKKKDLYLNM